MNIIKTKLKKSTALQCKDLDDLIINIDLLLNDNEKLLNG